MDIDLKNYGEKDSFFVSFWILKNLLTFVKNKIFV